MDTGLAYVSVTEAVQAALLANSERPNTPNDWDKTVTISSQLHTPKQNCYHMSASKITENEGFSPALKQRDNLLFYPVC